jgi:hypothetical protein
MATMSLERFGPFFALMTAGTGDGGDWRSVAELTGPGSWRSGSSMPA